MSGARRTVARILFSVFSLAAVARQSAQIQLPVSKPFRFVVYGDTRFTDPADVKTANPRARQALVRAIADVRPAFVSIGGDIVTRGDALDDLKVFDSETAVWRGQRIPVYPVLGNHDLKGDEKVALANYFQRFPYLKNDRYYSVHAANVLMLVLDSSQSEVSGPQGDWLIQHLDHLPSDVDFVAFILHHPPYTSSSDAELHGGGHSARTSEQALATILEARQVHARARFVVFSGHVHNYERHQHNGVVYFVTGGGGAHAYPIEREPNDLFPSKEINFHYLLVEVDRGKMVITMNRFDEEKQTWSQPDSTTITVPASATAVGQ